MKLWMRKVARGSAKIVWDSHTLQYDAPNPSQSVGLHKLYGGNVIFRRIV